MSIFLVGCTVSAPDASALQSSSYHFDEIDVGNGGFGQSSSANFKSYNSTGDLAIGSSSSASYQVEAGPKTPHDPTLSFVVNGTGANFGSFTASGPSVTTTTFSVSNYTSYGYVVQIIGSPPANGNHTISAMAATGSSQSGVEQFGINLVANTLPVSVGANPNNGQFGFGTAAANYGTSNKYRFVSGETIASAPKSSGVTTYTLSYLANVSSLTPGGQYTSNQTLVVTGTY
jgi:hypothetical protein